MVVSPQRYVELKKSGRLPRCRKNGCERLCGAQNPVTSREPEVLATIEVPLLVVKWPRQKRGNRNGALAKLHVSRDDNWRYDGCCDNG